MMALSLPLPNLILTIVDGLNGFVRVSMIPLNIEPE